MARLEVRLPDTVVAAAREAAAKDGITLSEFTRRALLDRVNSRTTKQLALAIADEVVTRLEFVLASIPSQATRVAEEFVERPFDPACLDADMHAVGRVCPGCGGSFWSKR